MRISDWSSDVCFFRSSIRAHLRCHFPNRRQGQTGGDHQGKPGKGRLGSADLQGDAEVMGQSLSPYAAKPAFGTGVRSEEHTSELQSLMRISYAVFCLKKKKESTTKELKKTMKTYKTQKRLTTKDNTT